MKKPTVVVTLLVIVVAALTVAVLKSATPALVPEGKIEGNSDTRATGGEHESPPKGATPRKVLVPPAVKNSEADLDAREAENIAKLKTLKKLSEQRSLTAEQLAEILTSSEGFWLKAAYLQAAIEMTFSEEAAALALKEALGFLDRIGTPTGTTSDDDSMMVEAYNTAIALLAKLNINGVYDSQLKEIYEGTKNPDFLKAISDKPYKSEKLDSLDDKKASEIIRESQNGDFLDKARILAQRAPADERPGLEKYVAQHSPVEAWKIEKSDDRKTKLMKLNGISASESPGKVAFVLAQWREGYYRQITDTSTREQLAALANPTYELAYALWTETDPVSRTKAESELYALFSADFKPTARPSKQLVALVDLAVAYVDVCVSNMLPKPCQEELHAQQSFARRLAADYLASLLTRHDAAQALGSAKGFVEMAIKQR